MIPGITVEHVDLTGARFHAVDLSNARFKGVDLSGAVLRGMELVDVTIDGEVENLIINGVDVAPLIHAELDRLNPDRVKMRPDDVDGFKQAWDLLGRLWDGTVDRARSLSPELLHEQVDGEWSFIQTLRHLVFATDSWIGRAILGNPTPYHPLGLPWDEAPADIPGLPRDRDARPSLDEVLAMRRERMGTVRQVIDDLTEEKLNSHTEPVLEPGWPRSVSYPVRQCLLIILNEEWQHRLYAERDLDALAARGEP